MHTNALDEAIALPTDFSARIARNTQIYLQEETGITKEVDPWGGSDHVEQLTADLIEKARMLMDEVEELGGMTKAIETGLPKMRIEEAAAKKQARIDAQKEIIVGVNRYQVESDSELDIRDVDNAKVRDGQIQRLQAMRASRDEAAVQQALKELEDAARGKGNLLEKAVNAARLRASLGEISLAMENVYGR